MTQSLPRWFAREAGVLYYSEQSSTTIRNPIDRVVPRGEGFDDKYYVMCVPSKTGGVYVMYYPKNTPRKKLEEDLVALQNMVKVLES